MQDRYAGDVGDFLKYSLLRWLCAPDPEPLSLGVLWYLTPDESHNADGRHVAYLDPGNRIGEGLRALDPDLHDRMRTVLKLGRSVAEVERSGALPAGTRFVDEPLTFRGLSSPTRANRLSHRSAWLDRALESLAGSDVVFVDPDNGIRPTTHSQGRHVDAAIKHAYVDELARFAKRGQGLVVYHHADRSAVTKVQAQRRLGDLADAGIEPIAAVRAARGTTRLFLVAGSNALGDRLGSRLEALTVSEWRDELTVNWWDPSAIGTVASRRERRESETDEELSDECFRLAGEVRSGSPIVHTLASHRPNEIIEISREGILVHTEKSRQLGEPQLVPGWMVNVAWEHLRRTGRLDQDHLVSSDGLNVKRSAFVMALLAHFPGVEVVALPKASLRFAVASESVS